MVMFCTESRPVNTQTSEVSGGRYGGIASSSWVPIPLPCRSGTTARRPNVALVPSTSTRIDPTSRWPSQAPRVTTSVRSRSARSSSMVWVSGGMFGSSYTCASLTNAARRTVSSSPASSWSTTSILTSGASMRLIVASHPLRPRPTLRSRVRLAAGEQGEHSQRDRGHRHQAPARGPRGLPSALVSDHRTDPDAAKAEAGTPTHWVLSLSCPDRPGIVHAVAGLLAEHGGNITESLLFGQRSEGLPVDIVAVVGNHTDLAGLAEFYGIAFHHVPVTLDKAVAEVRLLELVDELDVELVVLARYMQILSDDLCHTLPGRIINIHHSFLPSFKGARPYAQAKDRGVKLIGATAHYVTAALDEGPIIEQDVERVDHAKSVDDMMALGQDVERRALARAVRWHAEHRVLLNGHRTIVFR